MSWQGRGRCPLEVKDDERNVWQRRAATRRAVSFPFQSFPKKQRQGRRSVALRSGLTRPASYPFSQHDPLFDPTRRAGSWELGILRAGNLSSPPHIRLPVVPVVPALHRLLFISSIVVTHADYALTAACGAKYGVILDKPLRRHAIDTRRSHSSQMPCQNTLWFQYSISTSHFS